MEWFYWYLFGIVLGLLLAFGWGSIKRKGITLKWFEWLLGFLLFLCFTLLVETFVHSLAEIQIKAAWLSVLFLSVPLVVIAVVFVRSVSMRIAKEN